MNSVNSVLIPAVALVGLVTAVSGCATTQDANKRASLQADRTLASRKALVLHGTDPAVQVVRTSVIPGKDGSAIVVVLRNRGDAPVSDLPIEVGPRGGDPLNAGRNVPYFQSHAPAIAAGGRDDLGLRVQGEDRVGPGLRADRGAAGVGPRGRRRAGARRERCGLTRWQGGSSVVAEVSNGTGIPQYGLDVYAVARRGGRYVAAGRASLTHLGVDQKAELTLNLIGDAKGSQIQIYAPPTLFE